MKVSHLLHKYKKSFFVFFLFIACGFIVYGYTCSFEKGCGFSYLETSSRGKKEVTLPKGNVYVEVMDTPASRIQGLSGRSGLGEDEGMLFVFDVPGKHGFWMKDMLFSIDIIWIAENGVIVHVERNISPASYFVSNPPQRYGTTIDAKYVLELAAGQSEKFGAHVGSTVKIGE